MAGIIADGKRLEDFAKKSGWFLLENVSGPHFHIKRFLTPYGNTVTAVRRIKGNDWRILTCV